MTEPTATLTRAEPSPAQRLLSLPRRERRRILATMSDAEQERLRRDWRFWARPQQLEPTGDWLLWAIITGRGWGKTRTGAEWTLDRCEAFSVHGAPHRGGLIGKTAADVRDVMIEGESGIVACGEARGYLVKYEPSKRRVTLPELNSVFTAYTAEKPDQVRGHQWHTLWADEPAAWRLIADREGNTAWSNAMLALRLEGRPADETWIYWDDEEDDPEADLGPLPPAPIELQPRACATTTPKPIKLVVDWVTRARKGDPSVHLTQGSLYDNIAHLAPRFVAEVTARYANSRLGAQEIEGMLLEAVEGALWTPELIARWRVASMADVPRLGHVVVAIDPSGSTGGDEAGVVVVGVEADPVDHLRRNVYVLDDLTEPGLRPKQWAANAVAEYHRWRSRGVRTTIVAEVNFGAAMVADVIMLTDSSVQFDEVRASKGKRVRAEPVALVYDQGRAHHVGTFGLMEAEQCFAAGTLVTTDRGDVPIECVTADDRVWTRAGWKPVTWSGCTGHRSTITVETDDGRRLRCTPEHPVWVDGRGWTAAADAEPGVTLRGCRSGLLDRSWSSKGAVTTGTSATDTGAPATRLGYCIATCTKLLTARSRRGGTSITATRTGLITTSRISSRSAPPPTGSPTALPASPPRTRRRGRLDVGASGHDVSRGPWSVFRVGRRSARPGSEPCSARNPVVVATTPPSADTEPVYDITVADAHEFYANGLLVHNCTWVPDEGMDSPNRLDAVVWGITYLLPEIATAPAQSKSPNDAFTLPTGADGFRRTA